MALLRARERAACAGRTPVIVTSASSSAAHRERFRAAGFDGIMPKPLPLGTILKDLKEFMQASRDGPSLLPEKQPRVAAEHVAEQSDP